VTEFVYAETIATHQDFFEFLTLRLRQSVSTYWKAARDPNLDNENGTTHGPFLPNQ
jgi:hypothetical protein